MTAHHRGFTIEAARDLNGDWRCHYHRLTRERRGMRLEQAITPTRDSQEAALALARYEIDVRLDSRQVEDEIAPLTTAW